MAGDGRGLTPRLWGTGAGLLLSLLLSGCEQRIETLSGPTMGSQYSLKYVVADGVPAPQRVQAEVRQLLDEVDRQMSTWRADSDLSRFNQLPAGACQAMPAPVLALVRFGEGLSQDSDGAFDLTLEPLLDLWGFGPQSRDQQVPSAEQIAAARSRVGHQHLRLEGERLCKDVALQLDLNSIAAGDTVDRLGERLQALGIRSYVLDITGEVKAVGRKPDGSPWRVALEAPRDDRQAAQRILALDGLAVSTSGDYRNYFERDGQRFSHTLDPQTGAPIRHPLAAVTVVDASALRADGLSTLLMVLGPERGLAFAEQAGIMAFFVSRSGQGFVAHGTSFFNLRFGEGARP
ncbi:MAG: FAD:protein FMN transferase [Pseudomonas sp.]|uniref:FAD:protein FMN transferase n=1 Tax=Pseudomonas sp. TaxID=306 RepID=UPI00339B3301